jgi:hypothetical protein
MALGLAIAIGCSASAQEAKTFHGEISDTQCAMHVHSVTRSHIMGPVRPDTLSCDRRLFPPAVDVTIQGSTRGNQKREEWHRYFQNL